MDRQNLPHVYTPPIPPYISYLIVTIMSVALLAIQATIPFKITSR